MLIFGSFITIALLCVSFYYRKQLTNKSTFIRNWFNMRCQRVRLVMSLLDKIKTDISNPSKLQADFIVNEIDTSASIMYERLGEKYIFMVPYNRRYVAAMTQFKVELLREEKPSINITQQPGLPYIVRADELGGYSIKVTNEESGESHCYDTTPPLYGEEVMYQE